jgi:hypothetical protein
VLAHAQVRARRPGTETDGTSGGPGGPLVSRFDRATGSGLRWCPSHSDTSGTGLCEMQGAEMRDATNYASERELIR